MRHRSRLARAVPLLAVLAAACCWSTLGVTYRLILEDVDIEPITLVTIRATAAALIVNAALLLMPSQRHGLRATVRRVAVPVAVLGLVSIALVYVVLIFAFEEAGVAVTTVLLYLAPPLVAVGGWVTFRIPVTQRQAISLVVAFAGVAAVALGAGDSGRTTFLGIGLGVLSALTYASYSLVGRVAVSRAPSLLVIGLSLAIGTIALWPVKIAVDGSSMPGPSAIATIAIVNGLGATVLPLTLYTWGLSRVGPA